jgi:hypothetical protein
MEIVIESNNSLTPLFDRVYNMIFKVGIDSPTIAPKEILKNCIYLYEKDNSKNLLHHKLTRTWVQEKQKTS